MICTDHKRCSSRPSADRPKCDLERFSSWPFADKRKLQSPLQFSAALRVLRGQRCCRCRSSCSFVALRGQKEVAVAVAVLRGPPCPPWTKVLPLQVFVFLRGPLRTKGSCSRRCSSPRPSVSSVDKGVAVAGLRVPSWPFADKRKLQSPLQFSAALRVLRGQRCCRCRSSCSFVALCGQKEVAVAVAVLRGPPCPPWTKVLPLQVFAALRGPLRTKGSCSRRCSSPRPSVSSVDKGVAVAGLRVPSWPFADKRKLQSPLQFSAALRVLRGQRCCRCRSSRPFVALRGQKEVAVAVAVLRGPPCPPWTKVLPLQFSAALRVLRGQMCCRCSSPRPSVSSVDKGVAVAGLRGPSWPFADKRKLQSLLQFSAALRVLRGQSRCSVRRPCKRKLQSPLQFSRPFAALSWTKGSCSRRCRVPPWTAALRCSSPRPSVSSVDKCVAVAVLRGPPWLDQFMIPLISVQTNVNEPKPFNGEFSR